MKLETRFGEFGGAFVPQLLMPALRELESAFIDAREDAEFQGELEALLKHYAGRPTPLYRCRNLASDTPATILLKREDQQDVRSYSIGNHYFFYNSILYRKLSNLSEKLQLPPLVFQEKSSEGGSSGK